ncbi:MAG: YbaK/EbsC family protein [Anaerolineae bacterium]|nr:YbaK/EbsC family protein [Anaerolineae bacterium]
MALSSTELNEFLAANQIEAEIIFLEADTRTVAEAAAVLGAEPDQIIKSILFLADGEPVLVINNGLARVAWKQLADYLGVSRRRLKTANADVVLDITGFEVGAVPPFGHKMKLRTVVATAVYDQTIIYGGGGEVHALMKLTTAELQRVVGMETAVISE